MNEVSIEDVKKCKAAVDKRRDVESSESHSDDIKCSNERHLAKVFNHADVNPLKVPFSFMKR